MHEPSHLAEVTKPTKLNTHGGGDGKEKVHVKSSWVIVGVVSAV